MKWQDPPLEQTGARRPRWFVRYYMDVLGDDGERATVRKREYFGRVAEVPKGEAIKRKNQLLERINRRHYTLTAQIPFGEFVERYKQNHMEAPGMLSSSTVDKYRSILKNHIIPAFQNEPIGAITTEDIDALLAIKAKHGLSWASRADIKNLLSAIFTQARKWGLFRGENPAELASVGRKKAKREPVKLTVEQTAAILELLPADVREICETALYAGLRISEVLGLKWQHLDFERGLFCVRMRFYRGDYDTVKTAKARRDVPMGELLYKKLFARQGKPDEWVFSVATHHGVRMTREDRNINQHFLRPAAEKVGVYRQGFGFHQFRREAVTFYSGELGETQARKMAGHTSSGMTTHYTLADHARQRTAITAFQEIVESAGKAN